MQYRGAAVLHWQYRGAAVLHWQYRGAAVLHWQYRGAAVLHWQLKQPGVGAPQVAVRAGPSCGAAQVLLRLHAYSFWYLHLGQMPE